MGNSSGHCKAQGQIAYQQCKDNGGAERVCRSIEGAALDACKMESFFKSNSGVHLIPSQSSSMNHTRGGSSMNRNNTVNSSSEMNHRRP